MYKVGDKVRVISGDDRKAYNNTTRKLETVTHNGFVTTVTLVEEDDVVWIEDMNGGSVWIEMCNIEPVN